MGSARRPVSRSLSLAAELDSVTVGRHFVRDVLVECGLAAAVQDATLAVTELVANAVEHAGSPVRIDVLVGDDIVVTVRDRAPALRPPVPPEPLAEGGRGLQIVAAVARDWGITQQPDGKCLWFRLGLPAPDVAPPRHTAGTAS